MCQAWSGGGEASFDQDGRRKLGVPAAAQPIQTSRASVRARLELPIDVDGEERGRGVHAPARSLMSAARRPATTTPAGLTCWTSSRDAPCGLAASRDRLRPQVGLAAQFDPSVPSRGWSALSRCRSIVSSVVTNGRVTSSSTSRYVPTTSDRLEASRGRQALKTRRLLRLGAIADSSADHAGTGRTTQAKPDQLSGSRT